METTPSADHLPRLRLVDETELGQLAPALEGYPVQELLAVYDGAEPSGRGRARELVEACIKSWIATLDTTLNGYMAIPAASLARVRARQLRAREALHHLLGTVSCFGVVHAGRGQPC